MQLKPCMSNVNPLYKDFCVLKLTEISKLKLCCIVHTYIHTSGELPCPVKYIFTQHRQIHKYNTTNQFDLHTTHINTKIYGQKRYLIGQE